jgi:hypothetical protein
VRELPMKREILHQTRDRRLTPDEAAKYRQIRAEIEAEKREINAQIRAQREAMSLVPGECSNMKEDQEPPLCP